MSEVWAAAAVSVVGGVIAGKGAEKKDKADKAFEQEMTAEGSRLSAQRSGYDRALEDFYQQKDRARKQRGLDQFRQFSTMSEFAPNYDANSEPRVVEGEAPDYNAFAPEVTEEEKQQQSGGGRSIGKKLLDPLGLF